jgi:hypothetical protein
VGPGRGGAATPAARAASPALLQQLSQAISAARGFAVVTDQSSGGPAGTTGAGLSMHVASVAVRMGGTLHQYAAMTLTAAGHRQRSEIVYTGTQLCQRPAQARTWTCRTTPPSEAAQLTRSATNALAPAGAHVLTVPVGHRLVQGHLCVGYTYTYTYTAAPAGHAAIGGHGTIWLDPTTSRPVEDDAVTTIRVAPGRAPLTIRQTTAWSHWNDPTLRIPAVFGS